MKNKIWLLFFVLIFAGIFVGTSVNKWLGLCLIVLGSAGSVVCLWKKRK